MTVREKRVGDQCKKHPRFMAVVEPKPTGMYPRGCPTCWEIYKEKSAVVKTEPEKPKRKYKYPKEAIAAAKAKGTQFTSETSPRAAGVPKSLAGYIKSRTKNGKTIVDAMMEIAGVKPKRGRKGDKDQGKNVQMKDKIAALKWLAEAGFKIEEDGSPKDRPIQIVNYGELYVGPHPPV